MATIFENIISGVFPGRFVWADELCVAFATIEPTSPGHVLVVPREPLSRWTEGTPELAAHLCGVARIIGLAQEQAFAVPRAGLAIAGFEVPHTHLHVIPLRNETDILLSNAQRATDEELDSAMSQLRDALVQMGHLAHVPPTMTSPQL